MTKGKMTKTITVRRIALLLEREVVDLVRDWRLSLPGISFAFMIPTLIFLGVRFLSTQGEVVSAQISMKTFFPISVLIVSFFPSALTVVVALESFVGERERNTLESLLLTPVQDKELYVAKLLSSVVPPFLLGIISSTVYYAECMVFMRMFIPLWLMCVILALVVVKSVVLVSGASVISSQSRTVRAANLSSTIIVFPVTLLLGLESQLLMSNEYAMLFLLLAALIIYAALFVRTGMRIFNRENLLVHEHTVAGLQQTVSSFFIRFKQMFLKNRQFSFANVLREPFLLLYSEKKLILFMTVVFILAGFAGFYYAQFLVSETPGLAVKEPAAKAPRLPDEFNFFFFAHHNIRALLLACFLAPITFGATGLAFIFIPGIMIGFLCGMEIAPTLSSIGRQILFLFPHGVFEIPATLISAAFIFRIGTRVLSEKQSRSFLDRYLEGIADFIKILLIVIPLYLIAAFLESHFH